MTHVELMTCLAEAGCAPLWQTFVLDRDYSCPALDYIQKDFAEDFGKILWEEGLTEWKTEANDCDNFSLRAMDEAQKAHVKSRDRQPGKGLAFGLFFYYPEWANGGAHCINFAIIKGADGTHHPVFFEPQRGSLFGLRNLTQKERKSCFGYVCC